MLTTTTIHEETTAKIISAIEKNQTPPWRRRIPDLENAGFPTRPAAMQPFKGIDVLTLNMAAAEMTFNSKYWGSEDEWRYLGCEVTGSPTILADESQVYNADQTVWSVESAAYRSGKRRTPVTVDYSPAEMVIKASGATIHHRMGFEAAYYFPPLDHIVFPMKVQFVQGPGGLDAFYDSLLHEVAGHWTEPRLGWTCSDNCVRELRAEIAAPFAAMQLGIPVLCNTNLLTNHSNYVARWVAAMKADPTLISQVASDASEGVAYLLSLKG